MESRSASPDARSQRAHNLGVSRKVLAERLKHLVEEGMLERRLYAERPARYEYVLTRKGFEFMDVLMVMAQWGDRWTAGDAGPAVLRRHRSCGKLIEMELRCAQCGETVTSSDVDVEPGPRDDRLVCRS